MERFRSRLSGSQKLQLAIGVSIILTVFIVMVAIGWVLISGAPECKPGSPTLAFQVRRVGPNWEMEFTYVTCNLYLADFRLTIRNELSEPVGVIENVSFLELTPTNWDTYKVVFQKVRDESKLAIGAKMLFDTTTYPAGYWAVIKYRWNEFAYHEFQ